MKKSEDLLPIIQKATTREEAIEALNNVVEVLHLSQNYFHLMELKKTMKEHKDSFKVITDRYRSIPVPRPYNSLHELRMELSFLSRDFADSLAFEVNKAKIYHEEGKTVARAAGILELKDDSKFQEQLKTTSASGLRDMVGASGTYQEFTALAAVSYGLYQEFHKVGDSMKMFNDALASECREMQFIEQRDIK